MTRSTRDDGRPSSAELGRLLVEKGALTPDWGPAFAAVPRTGFLPEVMWPHDRDTGRATAVSRTDDPDAWHAYADSDVPIVTQWDDGEHQGAEPGVVFTSSSSMPGLVFSMLADLDVRPGQRVLEIGAGTGWNAALLAHRLGAENVVTVEVDPAVARSAREALRRAGYGEVEVVTGDGLLGHPPRAPYARVIATVGLRGGLMTWVRQTTPGGVILVPWGTYYGFSEATARLVVAEDGRSASGRFTQPVNFMRLRSQRFAYPRHSAYVPAGAASGASTSTTRITEAELLPDSTAVVEFALGLRVRDCTHVADRKREGRRPVWFYGLTDRSWAVVVFRDDRGTATVHQSGPRRLWDEVEAAYRWWEDRGRPGFPRFGLTVSAAGEDAWLDSPLNLVAPAAGPA
ncbi:putative O-methyltransferase [Actinacidiphila reveromycinica]|uniref:Protein-L-isoaspartate O-methyltransferase n=1 Tax=Actinacidiphila reveromycinica TaxID=659352 RepID=A0A7U3VRU1_9ACTN|nr:methyltransferase domain-containing protein [Streptomyces sp. SN-593]BBB01166.1 putative O-methyltransferase [Streptomyces sp. SN-593]